MDAPSRNLGSSKGPRQLRFVIMLYAAHLLFTLFPEPPLTLIA
jgi:hypothetical protein